MTAQEFKSQVAKYENLVKQIEKRLKQKDVDPIEKARLEVELLERGEKLIYMKDVLTKFEERQGK